MATAGRYRFTTESTTGFQALTHPERKLFVFHMTIFSCAT
jgi:hypothetical protein